MSRSQAKNIVSVNLDTGRTFDVLVELEGRQPRLPVNLSRARLIRAGLRVLHGLTDSELVVALRAQGKAEADERYGAEIERLEALRSDLAVVAFCAGADSEGTNGAGSQ